MLGQMMKDGEELLIVYLKRQHAAAEAKERATQMPGIPTLIDHTTALPPKKRVEAEPVTLDALKEVAERDAIGPTIAPPVETPDVMKQHLAAVARTKAEFTEVMGRAPTKEEIEKQGLK